MSVTGASRPEALHAGCVLLGEAAILIRGPSGVGKSALARALVETVARTGGYAAHVGDDRVVLSVEHGRVLARPHAAIAGRLEIRGVGIVRVSASAPAGVVRLVLDLMARPPRHPDTDDLTCTVLGLALPRLPTRPEDAFGLAMWWFRGRDDTVVTER